MAGQLRGVKCFTNGRNTGIKGCKFMPATGLFHILVPFDWTLAVAATDSDEDIASNLLDEITAKLNDNNYEDRFQVIGRYITFEDKSEAATMQNFNLGKKTKVNEGVYIHEYTYDNGGKAYHDAIRSFDGKEDQYKALRVDKKGNISLANKYDTDGVTLIGIQGIELDSLNVYPYKEPTFQEQAEYRVGFTYSTTSELNEDQFIVSTGVANLYGTYIKPNMVTDVIMIPFTATAARVHPMMFKTVAGDVNLADTLGTALNSTTIITAVNKTSGVSIAITSVALNLSTKKYVITFTAGAGYVAGQVAIVTFSSVSAWAALGAEFYSAEATVEITMA